MLENHTTSHITDLLFGKIADTASPTMTAPL